MTLGLLFSNGVSLKEWVKSGIYEREFLLYNNLLERNILNEVKIFTYGYNESKLLDELKQKNIVNSKIYVYSLPKIFDIKFFRRTYQFFMPIIHKKEILNCDVLKTNQLNAGVPGVISHLIFNKKIYLRTGYDFILFKKRQHKKIDLFFWKKIEKLLFKYSSQISMASKLDILEISMRNFKSNKINWLPNFIDTEKFYNKNIDRKNQLLFVGRLNEQKNIIQLNQSILNSKITCNFFGDGSLKRILSNNKYCILNGKIPNEQLIDKYNQYNFYILSSFYEGTPKTLLEAMSCGCVCIVTPVPGIIDIIEDNKNGLVCNSTNHLDISEKINYALKLTDIEIERISTNARKTIVNNYSLSIVLEKETQILNKIRVD